MQEQGARNEARKKLNAICWKAAGELEHLEEDKLHLRAARP